MSAVDPYVDQMDHAWSHRWESLTSALRGVDAAEAAWQAECYAGEEPEDGWPAPGTIGWHVAHVAHCKRYYADVLEARGREGKPEAAERVPCRDFADEMAALEAAHRRQVEGIRRLADADLEGRVPVGMSVREFLAHQARHDVWHASQIAVARRLYRTRKAASSR